jgi:hypothetical protein
MLSPNIEKLITELTIPCTDDGENFIDTSRLDLIQQMLSSSSYSCLDERPLAKIYKHTDFSDLHSFVVISCHIDSVYDEYFCNHTKDELQGTFDNSICNAILVNMMLEQELDPQALICFTGDEEYDSRGADQIIDALSETRALEHLDMVISLDITEEEYGKSYTIENLFTEKFLRKDKKLHFKGQNNLADYLSEIVPKTPIIIDGEADESWQYSEYDLNCFSFCIPCKVLGEDMHDNEGVSIVRTSIPHYANALSSIVKYMQENFTKNDIPVAETE